MLPFVAGVFVTVSLLAYVACSFVLAEDRKVSQRLMSLNSFERSEATGAVPALDSLGERFVRWLSEFIARFADRLAPSGYRASVKRRLTLAGSPAKVSAARFIMVKALSAAICAGLVTTLWLWHTIDTKIAILGLVPALVGGYIVPNLWTDHLMEDRQKKIRRELPDMLDMLTISVEAGLGFDAAIQKYVQSGTGVLADEFAKTLQETRSGVSRRDALRRLAGRTDVGPLSSLITSLIQADRMGTSISSVLRLQAIEMRLRRRQAAEESAQKLPVKMVFPTILLILPATMIVVLGPAVIGIYHFFKG